jgi:hypothetical protein
MAWQGAGHAGHCSTPQRLDCFVAALLAMTVADKAQGLIRYILNIIVFAAEVVWRWMLL